ncbi:MAG: divergent polysaccharide deacetylase family protein [Desulfobacterales bacterium]|nr:divergent polysaccharide deacetylase family protein [Desulfobacterales bacterium]MBS3755873.1 divergent polysaccharide deacetylase family protein [Desulfobacterales bacterium]
MAEKRSDSKSKTREKKSGSGKKRTSGKTGATAGKTATQKKTSSQKKAPSQKKRTSSSKKSSSAGAGTRKAGASKSGKKAASRQRLWRLGLKWEIVLFLGILAAVALSAGYYHLHLKTAEGPRKQAAVEETVPEPGKTAETPDYEIFPEEPEPEPRPEPVPPPKVPGKKPIVSIIIDDLGYERGIAEKFLSLECPLTYAILPQSPHLREIAEQAHQRGCQVMLHQPMEPRQYPRVDPGPGALLSKMSTNERLRVLKENLDAVPHLHGVNNHMGSKMTADSAHMNQVLSILKKRGLYFIDSRTTPETLSRSSARLFHVPFAERDVFLDHVPEPGFIRSQLKHLVSVAQEKGRAVGIGHPYAATYRVLSEELPGLKKRVRLVPASEVVSVKDS